MILAHCLLTRPYVVEAVSLYNTLDQGPGVDGSRIIEGSGEYRNETINFEFIFQRIVLQLSWREPSPRNHAKQAAYSSLLTLMLVFFHLRARILRLNMMSISQYRRFFSSGS